MSACVDDDGRPNHHVIRFHAIAPASAENTRTRPSEPLGASMIPDPTVSATPSASTAPSRFMHAAMMSAVRGLNARVPTEVAIAFAASWKPFV